MPKITEWSMIYPQFFADVSVLEDGGMLCPQKIIKDDFIKCYREHMCDANDTILNDAEIQIVRDTQTNIRSLEDIYACYDKKQSVNTLS